MKLDKERHMSIIFEEAATERQYCPHCTTDNKTVDVQPTTWSVALKFYLWFKYNPGVVNGQVIGVRLRYCS
jgi:hypothetical protein